MSLLEEVKKLVEKGTGVGRPGPGDLRRLIRPRRPHAYRFAHDGDTPNNPLPLVHYRTPVRLPEAFDPAAVFEELFAAHGWASSWRNGIYPHLHFHVRTHEVLGIARGRARVQLGGNSGRRLALKAGDVVVLPAGTGHRRLGREGELLVVGAYPENGGDYDEPCPGDIDRDTALEAIRRVRLPEQDPVYGRRGPLLDLWNG